MTQLWFSCSNSNVKFCKKNPFILSVAFTIIIQIKKRSHFKFCWKGRRWHCVDRPGTDTEIICGFAFLTQRTVCGFLYVLLPSKTEQNDIHNWIVNLCFCVTCQKDLKDCYWLKDCLRVIFDHIISFSKKMTAMIIKTLYKHSHLCFFSLSHKQQMNQIFKIYLSNI